MAAAGAPLALRAICRSTGGVTRHACSPFAPGASRTGRRALALVRNRAYAARRSVRAVPVAPPGFLAQRPMAEMTLSIGHRPAVLDEIAWLRAGARNARRRPFGAVEAQLPTECRRFRHRDHRQ